ncbi:MAG: BlaI/MecI/CopY family transcriptional regulator [Balneolaceae bacterium]
MKKSLTPLGETEMEILHHVWELGDATGKNVHERILKNRPLAYTTINTVLKNLVTKGYLRYRKEGVTYVYSAASEPGEVRFNLINDLVTKVFKGSPTDLIQTLVEKEDLTPDQLSEIKQLIEKLED